MRQIHENNVMNGGGMRLGEEDWLMGEIGRKERGRRGGGRRGRIKGEIETFYLAIISITNRIGTFDSTVTWLRPSKAKSLENSVI